MSTCEIPPQLKWDRVEPERQIPRTPLEQARTIPARFHRAGYHTNEPSIPLWKQVRESIKSPCQPSVLSQSGDRWCLEYIVITDETLAIRTCVTLIKHRKNDPELIFHMRRQSGLTLPAPV